jgi:hypothetical protein
MKEFLKGGFSLNLLSGLVLDKSEAVRMRNSNRMSLAEMYQHMYGPQITMTNLDKMATDLSQIARRTRPWTGKFLHSLIKGYPGFSINNQLNDALTILASRLQHRNEVEAQINEKPSSVHLPAVRHSSSLPIRDRNITVNIAGIWYAV